MIIYMSMALISVNKRTNVRQFKSDSVDVIMPGMNVSIMAGWFVKNLRDAYAARKESIKAKYVCCRVW